MVEIVKSPYGTSRLFPQKIEETLQFIRDRFAGREIIVLSDGLTDLTPLDVLDYSQMTLDDVPLGDVENYVFCLAFDDDSLGIKAARDVTRRGGIYFPIRQGNPTAKYWHFNRTCRDVFAAEMADQMAEGFNKWDDQDFSNLVQALETTRNLPGVYIEMGCFRGSSGRALTRYMNTAGIHRPCYFLDVFDGFSYEEAETSPDICWAGTHKTEGRDAVAERLSKFAKPEAGLEINVIKSNVISDPLPEGTEEIAVANLDVDIYEGVLVGLRKCAPRIVKRGILIVEDPGHTPWLLGARLALEEFMEDEIAQEFLPVYMESGQTFLIRTG